MKKHFAILLFAILTLGLCTPSLFAQSGTVKGVCKDADGKPMPDAIVVYANLDNGQKYSLKTNKKGEYFSLGITPGKYNVTLYKNADDEKAGKEADHFNGYQVQLDENNLDIDLKKEQEEAAKSAGMTSEQLKQKEQEQAKVQKENSTIKTLNEKLVAAKTAADGGDYDSAIADLVAANQIDPSRDLIWFKLGDYYRMSALKQTDTTEKQKRLDSAIESYQKAVDIRKATPADPKDPTAAAKNLAAYYNNLADAYAKDHKVDDAAKTYELAAAADPSSAASAYFNEGAVLTNAGKPDEANAAFDKCLAADPNRVEAYYQKGVNLLGKATLQGDKTIPAPGTVEALQKYLELAPNGPNAQSAKDLLASLGSSVETSYGKKKSTKK
jgi:tetratricopeptide (TPR) repeat protein